MDNVAADVAQQKHSNNKCYVSTFRYIYIYIEREREREREREMCEWTRNINKELEIFLKI